MREIINQAMKAAMKSGDKKRLGTLRLMLAAIKDRELGIGAGAEKSTGDITDSDILAILQKMVKQRRDSVATYRQVERADLVEQELAEIAVIEEFMPQQLDEATTAAAVDEAIAETGATSLKDMGKVMAALKTKYTGQMDFAKASGLVKAKLQ
jgi:uncharacterized protein YqeY